MHLKAAEGNTFANATAATLNGQTATTIRDDETLKDLMVFYTFPVLKDGEDSGSGSDDGSGGGSGSGSGGGSGSGTSGGSASGSGSGSGNGGISNPTPATAFTDVPPGAYYADAVAWAVAKGITSGTNTTTFSPDDSCTRGQMATFLWRAAGQPEPKNAESPFTDVKPDAYYYKAVLWAAENKITSGVSADRFAPDDACTRCQMTTFLFRYSKADKVSVANPFTDVKEGEYYYDSVMWAVKENVTSGTGATTFSPEDICTRGQMVTFLYRLLGK